MPAAGRGIKCTRFALRKRKQHSCVVLCNSPSSRGVFWTGSRCRTISLSCPGQSHRCKSQQLSPSGRLTTARSTRGARPRAQEDSLQRRQQPTLPCFLKNHSYKIKSKPSCCRSNFQVSDFFSLKYHLAGGGCRTELPSWGLAGKRNVVRYGWFHSSLNYHQHCRAAPTSKAVRETVASLWEEHWCCCKGEDVGQERGT